MAFDKMLSFLQAKGCSSFTAASPDGFLVSSFLVGNNQLNLICQKLREPKLAKSYLKALILVII